MSSTPLDDLSELHAPVPDFGDHIIASPTQELVQAQFVKDEELLWYQGERRTPKPMDKELRTKQITLVVLTVSITGFTLIFMGDLWQSQIWFIPLAALSPFILFWGMAIVAAFLKRRRSRQEFERNRRYYGLSSHALYSVQHGKAIRYDLRNIPSIQAVLPPSNRKKDQHKGKLHFQYQRKPKAKKEYISWEGVHQSGWLLDALKEQQNRLFNKE